MPEIITPTGGPTQTVVQATASALNATVVLAAGSALAGKVGIDQTTPGTTNGVQVNAALPAGSSVIGKTGIDQTSPGTTNRTQLGTVTFASDNGTPVTTAATTDVVSAPSAGHHLEVYYLHASNSSATAVLVGFKEASGTLLFNTNLPQNGVISKNLEGSWHLTTATKLQMVTSAAGSVSWTIGTRTEND